MIFLTIDLVHVNVKNFEALKSSNEMERKDDYRWTDSEIMIPCVIIVTDVTKKNIVWKLIDTHRCTHPGPENVLRNPYSKSPKFPSGPFFPFSIPKRIWVLASAILV